MAIYTLDGTDKEINVLGRYSSVKNNGSGTVYASSTPDLDNLEAPDIVPVQPGESVVVRDCKKKLYIRGSGQIAVESGNEPFNFFKSAPKKGGGDGLYVPLTVCGDTDLNNGTESGDPNAPGEGLFVPINVYGYADSGGGSGIHMTVTIAENQAFTELERIDE